MIGNVVTTTAMGVQGLSTNIESILKVIEVNEWESCGVTFDLVSVSYIIVVMAAAPCRNDWGGLYRACPARVSVREYTGIPSVLV